MTTAQTTQHCRRSRRCAKMNIAESMPRGDTEREESFTEAVKMAWQASATA
jgi:hypothetical protein